MEYKLSTVQAFNCVCACYTWIHTHSKFGDCVFFALLLLVISITPFSCMIIQIFHRRRSLRMSSPLSLSLSAHHKIYISIWFIISPWKRWTNWAVELVNLCAYSAISHFIWMLCMMRNFNTKAAATASPVTMMNQNESKNKQQLGDDEVMNNIMEFYKKHCFYVCNEEYHPNFSIHSLPLSNKRDIQLSNTEV